jgi:hypothetical protein
MTDAVGAILEERIVDLARICEIDPAELPRELEFWSTDDIEVHDLMADLRQETNHPPSGASRSSCHHDTHLEPSVRRSAAPAGHPAKVATGRFCPTNNWVCTAGLAG